MTLSAPQLSSAALCGIERAKIWLPYINDACAAFDISTPQRVAAFLAQVSHESGGFRWIRELWGPTPAQARYEGRADLGNTEPGDGKLFMGRGLIQVTGRANYCHVRDGLRDAGFDAPDFEESPQRMENMQWAAMSAAFFWQKHGLNELADAGDFEHITRRINGGLNGQANRVEIWAAAKKAVQA